MQTVQFNIPDSLAEFLRQQSAECGLDDYFEKMLRERQKEQALEKLEAELMKGLESGFLEPITPEYWVNLREELQQYVARKKEAQR